MRTIHYNDGTHRACDGKPLPADARKVVERETVTCPECRMSVQYIRDGLVYPEPTAEQREAACKEREAAQGRYGKAEDSFARCDTDGFLSQWAHQITAQQHIRQAEILDNGGVAEFPVLMDAATHTKVPAKLINGRFGLCWALLDSDGKFSGTFIKAHPARLRTMLAKGYYEGVELRPAVAVLKGSGTGLSGQCWVATVERKGETA